MKRNTLIIVEGPQGVGKTTFTNYLRENIASCDLHRLTGIKDKTKSGLEKVISRYKREIEYIKQGTSCELPIMIYDRNFFTDEIYARLGFKEYSFTTQYEYFLNQLDKVNLDIYLIILYLKDANLYKERLQGRKKFEYQEFNLQSSIKQQEEYLKLADEITKKTNNIKVIKFENDTENGFEERVNNIFNNILKKN